MAWEYDGDEDAFWEYVNDNESDIFEDDVYSESEENDEREQDELEEDYTDYEEF